jgi:hypothetical protein
LEPRKTGKKDFDSLSTGLSNGTLAFVFNKGLWGVGYLAEERRQRAVRLPSSPESRVIARDRKGKAYRGSTLIDADQEDWESG